MRKECSDCLDRWAVQIRVTSVDSADLCQCQIYENRLSILRWMHYFGFVLSLRESYFCAFVSNCINFMLLYKSDYPCYPNRTAPCDPSIAFQRQKSTKSPQGRNSLIIPKPDCRTVFRSPLLNLTLACPSAWWGSEEATLFSTIPRNLE